MTGLQAIDQPFGVKRRDIGASGGGDYHIGIYANESSI
jgi:hypothetical protein